MQDDKNQIDINKLHERMGQAFLFAVVILGDNQARDWPRCREIEAKGEEIIRYMWNYKLSTNGKFQLATLAGINMLDVSQGGQAVIRDEWEKMSEKTRRRITEATRAGIKKFWKVLDDASAARAMGVFDTKGAAA